jgi:hypothetical protein
MDELTRTTNHRYGTPDYYRWVLRNYMTGEHPHVLEARNFFRNLEAERINDRNLLLSNINQSADERSGLRGRSDIDFRYLRDDGAIRFPDRVRSSIADPNISLINTPAQQILEKTYSDSGLQRSFTTGGKKYRKKRSKSKRSKSKRSKSKRSKSKRSKSKRSKTKK